MVTWQTKVLPVHTRVIFNTTDQEYRFPNGSTIVVGGLDKSSKIMSSEYDMIYVQEATELAEDDWESLTTRLRNGVMPYQQLIADCNPGAPSHWLRARGERKTTLLLESRHEDNPTVTTDYLSKLDALTGVRYKRLRLGIWAAADGMVYDDWNPAIHLVDQFAIPKDWAKFRTIDFGFVHPFVCQWWAQDGDGRLYLYREMYGTQRLVQDWAALIWLAEFTKEQQAVLRSEYDSECAAKNVPAGDVHAFITWLRNYRVQAFQEQYVFTLSDHDSEDRATLERYGIYTQPAPKEVSPGIQAVQSRLRAAGDGKPRLYVFRDALVKADEWLMERRMPLCLEQEFESYVWAQPQGALLAKEVPEKKYDHGADAMRYLVYRLDGKGSYKPAQYKDGFFF